MGRHRGLATDLATIPMDSQPHPTSPVGPLSRLEPPLPPAKGKRRPPAPPALSAPPEAPAGARESGGFGSHTVHGWHNVHMAGSDHARRRASAPSATPPPIDSQEMPIAAPPEAWSSSGFSSGSRNGTADEQSWLSLEEENMQLREELARHQRERDNLAFGTLHWRRSMAAVAGGGFRGPSHPAPAPAPQKQCMCNTLRLKLARQKMELREALCRGVDGPECTDAEVQTLPREKSPPAPLQRRSLEVQTQVLTSEAASQALPFMESTGTQAGAQSTSAAATQAGTGSVAPLGESSVQTGPDWVTDSGVQAVACAAEVAIQAGVTSPKARGTHEIAVGTDAPANKSADTQVGCPWALHKEHAMQTMAPACATVGVQAAAPAPTTRACGTQSETVRGAVCATAAVQTVVKAAVGVATQVSPAPGVDQGCQCEDNGEAARSDDQRARIQALQEQLDNLAAENMMLEAELKEERQQSQVWKRMTNTKLLGQMNVTILCPRAECTVMGDRVEMDSWDPERLRLEFEKEVIPRYTRVFMQEAAAASAGKSQAEQTPVADAANKAMQEFAEIFRARLSKMLSASNANEAVATSTAPLGRTSSKASNRG
eukprot:gnl/TRDRNA2_/TRDRNA2_30832_c0_seq1.p1 gnl/TRDRNA2_/TRDRNA2_30832_c0~~gnl/TRDRNA2_/TRDRNA2_30832_c0_seq1.p1  ORF type:complete len:601 (-),score=127.75 gnl/TRDRNA2_/TRDRNA2_30832_c0_seq1:232-2034(-)